MGSVGVEGEWAEATPPSTPTAREEMPKRHGGRLRRR